MAKKHFDNVADALFSGVNGYNKAEEVKPENLEEIMTSKESYHIKGPVIVKSEEKQATNTSKKSPKKTSKTPSRSSYIDNSIYNPEEVTENGTIEIDPIYFEKKKERMQFVFRPSVKKMIQEAAAEEGISVNAYIEKLVLKERHRK